MEHEAALCHKMICPKCGTMEDKVVDSRLSKNGRSIRRRRECIACEHRFTTYEEVERLEMRVIKSDGSSEPFDKRKILSGLSKACERRPVTMEQLENAVEEIIQELDTLSERELPPSVVGAKAIDHIHALDEVPFVPFDLPFLLFHDVGDFIDEIHS